MIIKAGLDVGSTSVKFVALLPKEYNYLFKQSTLFSTSSFQNYSCLLAKPVRVMGKPRQAVFQILDEFYKYLPNAELQLTVTGSQAKLISSTLNIHILNEFKAIAQAAIRIDPKVRTILEIGGDGSRYLHVQYDDVSDNATILDYSRNGECAAGTGSFIDQQAVRLKYDIEEVGRQVLAADKSAKIAGRCSVFAKSDMIHAQQRGYSSRAILKGLCEAVVLNYKATIVHGKPLIDDVLFIGGVAANEGVVQAMRDIFHLDGKLTVPPFFQHFGALGCALLTDSDFIKKSSLQRLQQKEAIRIDAAAEKLSIQHVRFENENHQLFDPVQFDERINVHLGIDIGSVSTNLVLLDDNGTVLDKVYTQTEGRPIQVVQRELKAWMHWADRIHVKSVGTTGSGRELIGELVGADIVNDEITAHKTGATFIAKNLFDEPVDTIFEIGGQDSKFISIDEGVVVDFTMNEACAAGTGSFLEEQAVKMGIPIKEVFAELAMNSTSPLRLGERCTVFMEKDVTAFMQQGRKPEDICAGLSYAVVQNYLNRVVRDRRIGEHIFFQGGTAYNRAVAAAFATVLGKKITVPPHNGVMGAIGAALLSREKMLHSERSSTFRGFDLSKIEFSTKQFVCKSCTNHCDIQRITINNEHSYWGDKCSNKYRKKIKTRQRAVISNLVSVYNDLLESFRSPQPKGLRIGFPRSMYYYDRFPFWQNYFTKLGAELVLSEPTHAGLVAKGRELCIAEPCFPIVVGHGHLLDVFKKNIDYAFMPIAVNAETDAQDTFSWYCPWGQTLPIVIDNSLQDEVLRSKMLMPIFRFRLGAEHVKERLHPIAAKLGFSKKLSDQAVDAAYIAQQQFLQQVTEIGRQTLAELHSRNSGAIVILGRPYNIYDPGVNLSIPDKLYDHYGMNVVPLNFLPLDGIGIDDIHANMFWNYGRKILQACRYVSRQENLHVIYFTNFKCGPDSYIKHFVPKAVKSSYLTLQFDGHSNDAGFMTRCEAYLQSKQMLTF